jgi:D-galactose 1-dehydrogenase
MAQIRLALIGLGKIARDQHLPAIAGDDRFTLAATVDPQAPALSGVPHFASLDALLSSGPALDAAVFCTPPQTRARLASAALACGLHVFLEKPPCATLSEIEALCGQAWEARATLFAAWHSRFAPGVEPARAWLADRRIDKVSVIWREDVRVWHPGQEWLWQPGGFGVFDPGINALSILTHILPRPFFLERARLMVPANRAVPIAADVALHDTEGVDISMDLDFRQTGPQSWDTTVQTDAGTLALTSGGAVLTLPTGQIPGDEREYAGLYSRFEQLIRAGQSEVDIRPLRLVADAFLIGQRETVEAFDP